MKTISEAGIEFLLPKEEISDTETKHVPRRSDPVFFNQLQALNRDLSIMVLHAVKDLGLSKLENVAETFAGTGIRALRYAVQGPAIKDLYVNDISSRSIEVTKANFEHQKDKITSNSNN